MFSTYERDIESLQKKSKNEGNKTTYNLNQEITAGFILYNFLPIFKTDLYTYFISIYMSMHFSFFCIIPDIGLSILIFHLISRIIKV